MSKILGIDLGTTNSCVAIMEGQMPHVVANSEGSRTTPSIIARTENGQTLAGQIAKRQAVTNPEGTLYAVKRLIGRKFDSEEIQRFREIAPFSIESAENGDAWVRFGDRLCSPQEISSHVLTKMRETASDYLGEVVDEAVITVPAYFNDSQRQATKEAGRIAGLNVLRILNEPTAAALAYGFSRGEGQKIAVFDFGGGTFDISILELGDGVFEVLSTNGDTFLGGEDFDDRLVAHLIERFQEKSGVDLRGDNMALQRLKEAAERAKHELSSTTETEVSLPFIATDEEGPKHLTLPVTRDHFEELVADLIGRLTEPCHVALEDAGMSAGDIEAVVLVGGMTRMPRVQAKVTEIFGKSPQQGVNPDEVVASGAAIQGGVLRGDVDDVLLLDVTPLSLGVETQGSLFTKVIEKNTTIPVRKSQVFSTTEDNQSVVAIHVLQGERERASENRSLGRFELLGIPPAPRSVPQIEVAFDIDTDGVVNVSAQDLGTGQRHAIRVTAGSGLTEQQIQELVVEAEAHREADERWREVAELRNRADGLIYTTEASLAEYEDHVEDAERAALETALRHTREAKGRDDVAALARAVDELTSLSYKMTEKLYAKLGDKTPS